MLAREMWSNGKGTGMVYAAIEHESPTKYGNDDIGWAYVAGSVIDKLMADDHTR
jgi:hypothetical protein